MIALFILTLIVIFVVKTKLRGRFHKRLVAGLLFALTGDLLSSLSSRQAAYSNYAFYAYLIGLLFYIGAFYLDFRSAPELDKKGAKLTILLCGFSATCFFFFLRPHLGAMRIPVLVYTLIVSFMVMMAAFRNGRVNSLSFKLVMVGAVLFTLSDALFAYTRFVQTFSYSSFLIGATYVTAQSLITFGGITRKLNNIG